jgi:hypothetical protein
MKRRAAPRSWVALGVVWVAIWACGESSESSSAGLTCGNAICAVGQVCCIDCNGKGTCAKPGSVCAGTACLPTGTGGSSGGASASGGAATGSGGNTGLVCGGTVCVTGQVCCIDCTGRGTCIEPGSVCGLACQPTGTGGSGPECSGTTCAQTQVCCYACSGPGFCSDGPCPGAACPLFDASAGIACGPSICQKDTRCCDHCIGSCVNSSATIQCPDDVEPNHVCSDAGVGGGTGACAPSSGCDTTNVPAVGCASVGLAQCSRPGAQCCIPVGQQQSCGCLYR